MPLVPGEIAGRVTPIADVSAAADSRNRLVGAGLREEPAMDSEQGHSRPAESGELRLDLDVETAGHRACSSGRQTRQNAGLQQEASMKRKNMTKESPKVRLAVKKETLKDLSPKQDVRGGFIMQDTVIIRTGR